MLSDPGKSYRFSWRFLAGTPWCVSCDNSVTRVGICVSRANTRNTMGRISSLALLRRRFPASLRPGASAACKCLQAAIPDYNLPIMAAGSDAESLMSLPAHRASTSESDNAGRQPQSELHAPASRRPRRLIRSPYRKAAGVPAGACDLFTSER